MIDARLEQNYREASQIIMTARGKTVDVSHRAWTFLWHASEYLTRAYDKEVNAAEIFAPPKELGRWFRFKKWLTA